MKVIGIGNAIIDLICRVSDDSLSKNSLVKSTMKLINENEFQKLLKTVVIEDSIAGGSVANTIVGLSRLKNNIAN